MKNKKIYIVSAFVLIEIAFLFAILFSPQYVNQICWSSIVVAFLFSFCWIKEQKFAWLTITALLFTVLSDFCLEMLVPMKQSLAMTFFAVVQMLYFARLLISSKSKVINIINICVRIFCSLSIIIIVFAVLKDKTDYLSIISMLYFTNLILNVIFAFVSFKQNPIFAFGLLLFLCCDTIVGLNSAIGVYISVPETSFIYNLSHPPFNLAWTFYLPAQTLLSLSISKREN